MKNLRHLFATFLVIASLAGLVAGQQAAMSAASAVVPRLVNFSGKAVDAQGKPVNGIAGVTFSIYKDQDGGSPLWMETQNIRPDAKGNYSAQLGSTKSEGIPLDLFTTGEARWLGVRVNGGEEQPRVLLLSVPYALKAADAETIGGLPPSAFVLAAPINGAYPANRATGNAADALPPASAVSTNGGTPTTLPLFNTASDIENSIITQTGTGATAHIGIGTTTPAQTLDVKGNAIVRGSLSTQGFLILPTTGAATAAAGKNSQPFTISASSFSSTTGTAIQQQFEWQAEPAGNNTATESATLNLLFGQNAAKNVETGLKINSKGQLMFAAGQVFPIGSGSVTNTELQHSSLTVKAGTDLTGGGSVALGGTTTLNLDTTKVPLLAAMNTFTNQNTINVNTTCDQSFNCFPGLAINNTGGSASTTGGDGMDITTGPFSLGLRITSGSLALLATSNFAGAIFEGNGGGGLYGDEQVDEDFVAGVNGYQIAAPATHATIGVWGSSQSPNGFGVYGNQVLGNQSGFQRPAGIWGDSAASAGVVGTSDQDDGVVGLTADTNGDQRGGFFDNTSTNPNGVVLLAEGFNVGGFCSINNSGDLSCSGVKSAVVPVANGSRKVAMYAIEGPENWFEDAGSGQLSSGTAVVNLESIFGETVNTDMDYRVFLTPDGDCKGLYVAQKSATSFIVRELGGGTSNIAFDYRIMAKRKGYENVRLADKTAVFQMSKTPSGMRKALAHPTKTPPSPVQIREKLLKMAGARPVPKLQMSPTRNSIPTLSPKSDKGK